MEKRIFQVSPTLRNHILQKRRFRSLKVARIEEKVEVPVLDPATIQEHWQIARQTFPREKAEQEKEIVGTVSTWLRAGHAIPETLEVLKDHNLDPFIFCETFNKETRDYDGKMLQVDIFVYRDRTYSFTARRKKK